jgi:DNA-binding winged helix-turn-helix (wHTH) protein/TolB-like protein
LQKKSPDVSDKSDITIDLGNEAPFSVGSLLARPAAREIEIEGRVEMIEPRVMQVLTVLARRRGDVVSRDQLVESCWSGRVVGDDAITRCIAKVRRLCSPTTFDLETIPRVGYRLVELAARTPVEQSPVSGSAEKTALIPADSNVQTRTRIPRRHRIWLIASAIVVLFIAAGSYWTWRLSEAMGASSIFEAGAIFYGESNPDFAVLPFDSAGGDVDTGYLADAIPAAINSQLIALGFQLVSPAVVRQYRGERKSQASAELNPRYFIDGTVSMKGDTLHVTTRVDSALQGVSVWSRDFQVDVREASELPNRIATTLAGLTFFSTTARSAIGNAPAVTASMMRVTERSQAGDDMGAYLLAKALLRETPNAVSLQATYAILTGEVLDLLPSADRASALADARLAQDHAERILPLGAPVAKQSVMPAVDWSAREHAMRKAIDADAQLVGLRYTFAGLLVSAGRIAEANSIMHEAVTSDPLIANNTLLYATVLDIGGNREDAEVLLARAERLWPNRETFALLRFMHAIGNADLQVASAMLDDPTTRSILEPRAERMPYATIVRALSTRHPNDIAAVELECSEPGKITRRRFAPCLIALAKLDRLDAFFRVAEIYFPDQRATSSAERDARWLEAPLVWRTLRFLFRTDLAALRADERFIGIAERMGLLDYWRTSGKWPDFCAAEPKSVCGRMRGA